MNRIVGFQSSLRIILGVLFISHGLLRMLLLDEYISSLKKYFSDYFSLTTLVTFSGVVPFLEILVGILLFLKIKIRWAILSAMFFSVVMIATITIGDLDYIRLIYHIIILSGLVYLYYEYRFIVLNERTIYNSKRKIYSRRN